MVVRGLLLQLLRARWEEHLAEGLLSTIHPRAEGLQLQMSLMNHRLKHTEQEAKIYSMVLGRYNINVARELIAYFSINRCEAKFNFEGSPSIGYPNSSESKVKLTERQNHAPQRVFCRCIHFVSSSYYLIEMCIGMVLCVCIILSSYVLYF